MARAKAGKSIKTNNKLNKETKAKKLSIKELLSVALEKKVFMIFSNGNDYDRDVFINDVIEGCGLSSTTPIIFTLEEDINYISSYITTRSLVYDGCVIIFKYNTKQISKKIKYNKKTDTIGNILAKIIENKYENHLVIFEPDVSDKRNTLQKKIDCVVEFESPTEKQLRKFIVNYNKSVSLEMTDKAIDVFISMILPDYYVVKSEIDKLSIIYDKVDDKIIKDNIFPTSEVVVFDIIDSMCKKKKNLVYNKINAYINNGGNYFALISLLSRNFHYMYYAKVLKSKFVSTTKQPVFLANKYIENSKYYSEKELVLIMELIVETIGLLKTDNNNENVVYRLIGRMM